MTGWEIVMLALVALILLCAVAGLVMFVQQARRYFEVRGKLKRGEISFDEED